ncbi:MULTISPECIES: PRC-barrel domain-containing protein [Rhodomicrobium]|uniref:PRC-barrel domain-containing protein n=1 Tax=Rhodomicrobium TaxID=1068 RepID=UPI000B4AC27E|nr:MULTISPECIES: PRC-barrel domain-containing protein [Rhodomicrobium]
MNKTLFAALFVALATPVVAQTAATAFKTEQAPGEWRAFNYIGQPITNSTGEKIGAINDVLFDRGGKITTVVIGVGGFLGLGQKNVALPFEAVTYGEKDGAREILVPLSKEALQAAPDFKLTEQTAMDKVREKAGEVAAQASEKAVELKDQAVKKIDEYRKEEPAAAPQRQ